MKRIINLITMLALLLITVCILPTASVKAANPYLPLWEHVPDGEPRVFEDPDEQGKYRAYIFGSHDTLYTEYCGTDIRAWSAPVEDLTDWRDEGSIFSYQSSDGSWDIFSAPDVVEVIRRGGTKEYYLYPQSMSDGRSGMVCKGDSPIGPFESINLDGNEKLLNGSILGFAPSVYVEQITDPNDPDYDIGFRAYAYWGGTSQDTKSRAVELDQNTMYSARPGKQVITNFMPCSSSYGVLQTGEPSTYPYIFPGENYNNFNFFEASSIRKIENKYIMVYCGYSGPEYGLDSTDSAMRWCYGDTPLGPWKFGGVLVDSRGVVTSQDGTTLTTSNWEYNTHGSIQEINGQWYVFYHRAPRDYGNARQSMVAPIKIECDSALVADGGKIRIRAYDPYSNDNTWTAKAGSYEYTGAEVTSEGFEIFGLEPYKYYSAGIACYFLNDAGNSMQDTFDIWDDHMPMTNVENNHIIGFKYFGFGGLTSAQKGLKAYEGTKPGNNTKLNLFLTPKTTSAFKINIWMDGTSTSDGTKIGEINVPAGSVPETTKFTSGVLDAVDNADKKHAIYLVVEGSDAKFDFIGLGFSSDTKEITSPDVPQVSIFVDEEPVTMPTTPVLPTAQNGLTGYIFYETTHVVKNATDIPVITATSTSQDVGISITPPSSSNDTAVVEFDYNGAIKTYQVQLCEPLYGITLSETDPYVFAEQNEGYSPITPHPVTVTNTSNRSTGALTVALSGANANSFTLSATSINSIAEDGTDGFTIKPNNDLAAETYTAAVTVSGRDGLLASFNVHFTVASNPVTITFKDGGSVINKQTIEKGQNVIPPSNPTKKGYTFIKWDKSLDNVTEDLEVNALWTPINYSITFNINGGVMSNLPKSYTIETATINLPKPDQAGYTFAGWYENSTFTNGAVTKIDKGSIGNKKYWAKWTANSYKVSFNKNGGTGSLSNQTIKYGTSTKLTKNNKIKRSGWIFAGWSTSKTGSVKYIDNASVKNLTAIKNETIKLYAQWNKAAISGTKKTVSVGKTLKLTVKKNSKSKAAIKSVKWTSSAKSNVKIKSGANKTTVTLMGMKKNKSATIKVVVTFKDGTKQTISRKVTAK